MKIGEWLNLENVSMSKFAKDIGVSVQAVHRYARGERIPQNGTMQKIVERTSNQVTANDFYQ